MESFVEDELTAIATDIRKIAPSDMVWSRKMEDMSLELKHAYNAYDAPERKKQWEKDVEEGTHRAWE